MKRKLAYLALPLLLAALMFGAKWRRDNPTPTEEDLEIRALMSQSIKMQVIHSPPIGAKNKHYSQVLQRREFQSFIDDFYLVSPPSKSKLSTAGVNGWLEIAFLSSKTGDGELNVLMTVDLGEDRDSIGKVMARPSPRVFHPVTMKRWMELFLTHPRIGPELRARLK